MYMGEYEKTHTQTNIIWFVLFLPRNLEVTHPVKTQTREVG